MILRSLINMELSNFLCKVNDIRLLTSMKSNNLVCRSKKLRLYTQQEKSNIPGYKYYYIYSPSTNIIIFIIKVSVLLNLLLEINL